MATNAHGGIANQATLFDNGPTNAVYSTPTGGVPGVLLRTDQTNINSDGQNYAVNQPPDSILP